MGKREEQSGRRGKGRENERGERGEIVKRRSEKVPHRCACLVCVLSHRGYDDDRRCDQQTGRCGAMLRCGTGSGWFGILLIVVGGPQACEMS